MNINPMALMRMKPLFEAFRERHPKFLQFFGAAGQCVGAESLIEISVTSPDGKKMITNMRVKPEDLELFDEMKNMMMK